jgi:hypothetical protein
MTTARDGGGDSRSRRKRARSANRTARISAAGRRAADVPLEQIWRKVLERRLRCKVRVPIAIRVTDNVHTMISFSRRAIGLEVRLHHMFLAAPPEVVDALARYIDGGSAGDSETLDHFIERHRWLIRRIPPHVRQRRIRLFTRGQHYDLAEVFDDLAERYFGGPIGCAITWGSPPRATLPRQSIKLGSYSEDARLIRIHPALDQPDVPRFFLEWIVFHEMLHHRHGATVRGNKRWVHTPEFLADERRFPHYERARAWEREHLEQLLSWRPRSGDLAAHRLRAAAYTAR